MVKGDQQMIYCSMFLQDIKYHSQNGYLNDVYEKRDRKPQLPAAQTAQVGFKEIQSFFVDKTLMLFIILNVIQSGLQYLLFCCKSLK